MGKTLVIAEKPSVAGDIARALGKVPKKNNDYFENDDYVISSAIGHLVELCLPGELDKKRGKWSFANLPIIPDHFELKPIEKTTTRFNLLKRLMRRKDVDLVVNACDAGREGELIFRYIVQLAGSKKPSKRLWLQSMTPDAIRQAFQTLRTDEIMRPLAQAAISRSESDWLVGINSTRAMTAFNSKLGGFQLTPVGRVQTPTLSILAEREDKILQFKPRTYFEVFADFDASNGEYRGRWFDPKFKKGDDEHAKAERLWEKAKAEAIAQKCAGKPGSYTEEKKPSSQICPLLYDLTSLQREANGRFGFSARRTLQIAQQLYERYKVLTYPRTDSRHLPDDYLNMVKATMSKIDSPDLEPHARKAIDNGWVRPSKRIFDRSKVTDHHAIIPTGVPPKNLDEAQWKIYTMVTQRFIAIFYPPAQFETTTRITTVEEEKFRTEGKILTEPGYLAVYGRTASSGGEGTIVPLKPGETPTARELEVKENQTKPPPRYTEATLLSAMEGAGKLVEDDDLREAMAEKGLGTPATRAAIIEGLINDKYVVRQGKELIVSSKGRSLIQLLSGIGIDALSSAALTGEWEYKLKQIEQGRMDREEFMREIRRMTEEIVDKAKNFEGDTVEGNYYPLEADCPRCGEHPLHEDYRTYYCKKCEYRLWKTLAGREFSREEVIELLKEGRVGPIEGFRSKMGRPFTAEVKLSKDEAKPEFDFGDAKDNEEPVDFSDREPLAECTVCGKGKVYEHGTNYVCENTTGPNPTCKFRMGRTILQRDIPVEQMRKILADGKTDLLPRFISKKGRPFNAFLKLENGKVGFEFEQRKPAAKKGTKKKSDTSQEAEAA